MSGLDLLKGDTRNLLLLVLWFKTVITSLSWALEAREIKPVSPPRTASTAVAPGGPLERQVEQYMRPPPPPPPLNHNFPIGHKKAARQTIEIDDCVDCNQPQIA